MSYSFIHYKGKKILYVDYTKCTTVKDTIDIINAVRDEYLRTTENYLSLNNFTNVTVNNEYMEVVKKYGKEIFDARTTRNAAIGITGIKKVLLGAYNLIVKNKLIAFDTKEEALEYLVKE
ncbi:MAG: hypothetical protein JW798_09750 [Prolixibacteraceae bacterium]|nr:hypothetical protein [Prolixibacteraceae bacterium]